MDKMVLDVNVLGALFHNGIWSHKNGFLVIPANKDGLFLVSKFMKQSLDPDSLAAAIWECHTISWMLDETECFSSSFELQLDKILCEDVSILLISWDIVKFDFSKLYCFTDIVIRYTSMFDMPFLSWIWSKEYCALVVDAQW